MKILITGVSGFIGRNLCPYLKTKGWIIRGVVQSKVCDVSGVDEYVQVEDINGSTDWQHALAGVDTVIHLAARAYIVNDPATDSVEEFRKVNVLGTGRLAQMAAQSGVKRFIFISSVKVNGEGAAQPYTENDLLMPQDAYGISKREAEELLARIAFETGLSIVILRSPLVYGPGVKGNFLHLIRLVDKNIPLPFSLINNKRSFIYVGNLCDIIKLCLIRPEVTRQSFLVSDGVDLSTPQLISIIAKELKKKANLFPFPVFLLRILGLLIGKINTVRSLTDSLCVQTKKLSTSTGWTPRFSVEEGIARTVGFYNDTKKEKVA